MRFGDSGVDFESGTPRLRVIGDIMIRCLRVCLPFAIVRGVKRAEEDFLAVEVPIVPGEGSAMAAIAEEDILENKMKRNE